MKDLLQSIRKAFLSLPRQSSIEITEIYPGIALAFLTLKTDTFPAAHEDLGHVLQINYCRRGRIGWNMGNNSALYLGPGDFSLHTMDTCVSSAISLPAGSYEGLIIFTDLDMLTNHPPDILSGTGITGEFLRDKFCRDSSFTSLAGDEQTERIFTAFYGQPEQFGLPWQRIKVLELLLLLAGLKVSAKNRLTEYQSEQIETIRNIHELLVTHLEQRFTIEALSKQYLMNPTTLKAMFKSVYGTSIAAHIKEHRMEQAAKLLRETDLSIAEISGLVGYDSQSRFASAFKEAFGQLPKAYRK